MADFGGGGSSATAASSADDVDWSSLPLPDRLVHKNWKARAEAYDQLAKLFRTLDPDADTEYRKWQDSVKKMLSDPNAVAHEASLPAVLAFVENAPFAAKTRNVLAPIVVDKCLGSTRSGTKAKGIDILLMYVEVDNKADGVIEDVVPGLDHKNPKNIVSCITVLKESLRLFGVKVFNVKPVLKQLPKLFDHKDKSVRAEATALAVEMYRWLGPALMPSLNELKPVQLKELNDMLENLPQGRTVPERLVRSEKAKREASGYNPPAGDDGDASGSSGALNGTPAAEPEPIDPFDISDPVNVLDKMPSNFYDQLASTKWQERKEILQTLLALIKFPKLEDGRYGELVSALSKKVNDSNVNVAADAIRCIEGLAKGLRTSFAPYRNIAMGPLIERLKEKKQNVIEAIRDALDALFKSVTVPDIVEDVVGSASHKNPQVRSEVLQWLVRCLRSIRRPPGKPEVKAFAEMLVKAIDDSDSTVRESAAEAFGTLMKIVTERAMAAYLEKMDKTKESKVREFFDKAEVRVGGGGGAVKKAAPVAATGSSASSSSSLAPSSAMGSRSSVKVAPKKTDAPSSAKKSASSASLSKPTSSTTSLNAPSGSKKAAATAPVVEVVSFKYSDDSAEAWMTETFPAEVITGLSDSAWKTRLQSAQSIAETLKAMDPKAVEAEAVIRFFCKTPGFKESNFQVMTTVLNAFVAVAKVPSFTKGAASLAIGGLVDKVGDAKVKKVAVDVLTAFAESVSLGFVFTELNEPLRKHKSPKVLADGVTWMHQSVTEFGVRGVSVREAVDFCKFCLGNSNQAVRNSAITLLGALRMFVGPDIRTLVADVSPQIMTLIDAEFEKVASRQPPQPTKAQAVPDAAGGAEDQMDDMFPRIDLSAAVTPETLDNLGDAQWKVRKEALEEVSRILESCNRRIKPNLGELPSALKARLSDSNKNLAMMAVEICGVVAVSMGRPFDRHVRTLFAPMAALLADQKAHIRSAALAAIDHIFTACGVEPCITSCGQSLMLDQPQMRKDLLKWLSEKLEDSKERGVSVSDMQPMVHPILLCLQDKNADVRKYAAAVLQYVVDNVGADAVRDKAGDLFKGAALASLTPFLDAARSGKSGSTAAASAPPPAAKAPLTPSKLKRMSTIDAPERSRPSTATSGGAASSKSIKPRPASVIGALSLKRESPAGSNDVAGNYPFVSSDIKAKETRASQDRGMNKWTFETPRRELVDFLAEQCEGNLSAGLTSLLFSTDHYKEKDFLSGLTLMDEGITSASSTASENMTAVIANSDLVLKYLTIRFFDTNTSTLLKSLEVLEHLFGLLDEQSVTLSEYEASAFLPFFINKVGDNKETIRAKIRSIMRQICRIYPASKFFGHLMDALKSKNSRTRAECLEELAELVKRNGISVCSPAKVFPVIAVQIADSDAKVRNAAIGVVTQAYLLIRDDVYKHLGRISDKDRSMIEEKIKRLPPPQSMSSSSSSIARPMGKSVSQSLTDVSAAAKSSNRASVQSLQDMVPSARAQSADSVSGTVAGLVGVPGGKRPMSAYALPSYQDGSGRAVPAKPFSLDLDKLGQFAPSRSTLPSTSVTSFNSFADDTGLVGSMPSLIKSDSSLMLDLIVAQITAGDAYQSIEALKQLEKTLTSDPSAVRPQLDEIITAVTLQVRIAFTAADLASVGTGRLCKHLVNVLVQIFSVQDLARGVGIETLQTCIQELLNRLLDPILQGAEVGTQLARALNVLMVRILENSDRNKSFSVLLNLLQTSTMNTLKSSSEEMAQHAKYTELVMKCLWKMTKVIPQLLEQGTLDVEKLILTIHEFLEISPPSDWKRRAAEKLIPQADMPLRTVKTILHEIVVFYGAAIMKYANVPDPEKSHAVTYIKQMLEKVAGSGEGSEAQMGVRPRTASPTLVTKLSGSSETALDQSRRAVTASPRSPVKTLSVSSNPAINTSGRGDVPARVAAPGNVSVEPSLSEEEADDRLKIIFDRIAMKDETKQGISDLHTFRKHHPEHEPRVAIFLGRTGSYFQGYIKRGLATLEEDEARAAEKGSGGNSIGGMTGAAGISRSGTTAGSGDIPRTSSQASDIDSYKETLARLQQRFANSSSNSLLSGPALSQPPSIESLARTQLALQSSSRLGSGAELQDRHLTNTIKLSHSSNNIISSGGSMENLPPNGDRLGSSNDSIAHSESGGRQTVEELKQRLARMKLSMPSEVQ